MNESLVPARSNQREPSDPWARNMTPEVLRSGVVFAGDTLLPHTQLRRTAYYSDFARRYGIVRCVAGMIEAEQEAFSCISVNASERRGPFTAEEQRILTALMKPIRRALDLHRRLATAEEVAGDAAGVLNRVAHGVFLITVDGKVVFENEVARRIVAARDGLIVEDRELRATRADGTRRLRQAITNAARRTEGRIEGDTFVRIERSLGKPPLSVLVSLLPSSRMVLSPQRERLAVFVTAPELLEQPVPARLRVIFNLTPAEAELVSVLVGGSSLNQAAENLGLARDTVRKRLKTVFSKTNTHSQSELMKLVLTTAPFAAID